MGQLVFQATLGGQVNLVGPNTASTFNLSVPATTSTLATTSGTETLTNKTLTSPTLTSPNITTALTLTGAAGTAGQALVSGGTGAAPTWSTVSATPGGSTTQVQYNNAGAFAGSANLIFDGSNLGVGVTPSAWSVGTAIQVKRASFYTYDTSGLEISQNAAVISGAWQRIGADFATKYAQDTGKHYWYTAASSTAGSAITWTQAMTLNANGALALLGASTTATGVGITFPATQSASTDANTLDDYEEGTWTPTITFGGSSTGITYAASSQIGTYTKIGNLVTIRAYIALSNKGSSTGAARIADLPFTPINTLNQYWAGSLGVTTVSYTGYPWATTLHGTAAISLKQTTEAGTSSNLVETNFANSSELYYTGQFQV